MLLHDFPSQVKKIAVLRANALGDFVFVLPALAALRSAYPEAEIVYLGKEWHKEYLEGRPGPWSRIEVVPRYNGIPHEKDRTENTEVADAFFERMQAEGFDLALQMHGGGRNSNPFVQRLGAKFSAGFKTPDATPLDLNIPYIVYHNEILRYLELAVAAGGKIQTISPQLAVTERDRQELRIVVSPEKPFIVLHPGGSSIRRRWSAENFALVADELASEGYMIYLTGSPEENVLTENVMHKMKNTVENLCGKLSLHALTALLAKAELVITNDTGPLHLARALKTPTMGLFWGVNMIMASPVTAATNKTCISWRSHCPKCGLSFREDDFNNPQKGCEHDVTFLDEIEPAEVLENIAQLLGNRKVSVYS